MASFVFDKGPGHPPQSPDAVERPACCPSCRSVAISTTARNPDEHAYWRCGACGEVWNAARRTAARTSTNPWR